jgi:hypothetical protein
MTFVVNNRWSFGRLAFAVVELEHKIGRIDTFASLSTLMPDSYRDECANYFLASFSKPLPDSQLMEAELIIGFEILPGQSRANISHAASKN